MQIPTSNSNSQLCLFVVSLCFSVLCLCLSVSLSLYLSVSLSLCISVFLSLCLSVSLSLSLCLSVSLCLSLSLSLWVGREGRGISMLRRSRSFQANRSLKGFMFNLIENIIQPLLPSRWIKRFLSYDFEQKWQISSWFRVFFCQILFSFLVGFSGI